MRKPWQTKEWIQKRKEYLKGKYCEQCDSRDNLVIHHPQKKNSLTTEEYTSFKGTIILCNRCHLNHHKGYELCPECKKKYKKRRYETCWNCKPKLERDEILDPDDSRIRQYIHPWCDQQMGIEVQYWDMESQPRLACIEHCSKTEPNSCEIAKKNWDDG